MDSMLFERTAISKKPEQTIKGDLVKIKEKKELSPALTFRDPYVLDFEAGDFVPIYYETIFDLGAKPIFL